MATTTNYGWTTPDDTALVKDGASAIRTLGSSVDTTTKNLNPETTLGDIAYRSSTANVNTRLGIGSTSQVLTVTGGVPVWATPAASGGMTLISTTTLSGATVTISSIPASYKNLQIIISDVACASNNTLTIKPNNISPDSIGNMRVTGSTLAGGSGTDFGTAAGSNQNGVKNVYLLDIYDYASARYKLATQTSIFPTFSSGDQRMLCIAGYLTTDVISSLTITSSVSMTAGTCLIYGVS